MFFLTTDIYWIHPLTRTSGLETKCVWRVFFLILLFYLWVYSNNLNFIEWTNLSYKFWLKFFYITQWPLFITVSLFVGIFIWQDTSNENEFLLRVRLQVVRVNFSYFVSNTGNLFDSKNVYLYRFMFEIYK